MDGGSRRCDVCGLPLRPSQADTCGSASCLRIRSRRPVRSDPGRDLNAVAIENRRAAAERDAAVERTLQEKERELRERMGDAAPVRLLRARLPASERTPAPLPDERRETFAVNLRAALDRAMDDPDRPVPVTPETPAGQAPRIAAACAACRGSCCASGGDHAYLYPDHFRLVLKAHPDRPPEEIASGYLSRVPAVTIRDSCVYHTESGCALPREMRANLCNTFLCGDLTDLLAAAEASVPVLAVCFRGRTAEPVRSALLDGLPLGRS